MTAYDPPIATCTRCGRRFRQSQAWFRQCRLCYFEIRGDLDMALAEEAFAAGYELGRAHSPPEPDAPPATSVALASLPLRELISLCHPDRHPPERGELATTITAWLNELRARK